MSYDIIKTIEGDGNYHLFDQLPKQLYCENSPRWILGNDPREKYLEGCYVLLKNKLAIGRFAFYENNELKYKGESAATIGSYECINEEQASKLLLDYAINKSKELGYKWLLGPMEGSTWSNYRFSLHNNYPNFFMEPYHHIYYNDQFKKIGFETIADYMTNIDRQIVVDESKLKEMRQKFEDKGLRIRNIEMNNFEAELSKIGALSIEAFSDNFLYTSTSVEEFVSRFIKLGSFFDPDFILLVEDKEGEIQAIMFVVPDHLDPKKETIIVKSMARRKDSNLRGIGYFLGGKILEIGKSKGFKKVIHAMIISDNASLGVSKNYAGEAFKKYALYGMRL